MYHLIGADGNQYGPVTTDQVRQWIREGRANGQTQARGADTTDWKSLSALPEFADVFGVPPPAGAPPLMGSAPAANAQPPRMAPPPSSNTARASNKVAAGICGILLGGWGVHKFILGYTGAGTLMMGVSLASLFLGILTCGILLPAVAVIHIIGLIEGIIYLTKTDEEFVRIYVDGRKEWF